MTEVAARATHDGPRPHKSEQDPASEEIVEVAPGVLRMQLPIWLPGLGHVNMYGLVDDKGLAIIDPGLPGPSSWKALKKRLGDAGFRIRDVHTVIVTHSHPDHFGGAGRLAEKSGAPIVTHHAFSTWTVKGPSAQRALSEGEARRLEHEAALAAHAADIPPDELATIADEAVVAGHDVVHDHVHDDVHDPAYAHAGVIPDDTRETEQTSNPWGSPTPWGTTNPGPPFRRRVMIRALRLLFTAPEPSKRVHHGEHLRLAGREWQVLHTPGHTVDHLCLFDAETGTLLSGDHVLPTITPHVSGVSRGDSLRSYLATLDLVGDLEGVKLGLPAHGVPFDDVPGRVDAIKRHHEGRMEQLRDASLALGSATVVDLSHAVFPKKHWGVMAESETFAHLEHLAHEGQAEAWSQSGQLYYRVAPKS